MRWFSRSSTVLSERMRHQNPRHGVPILKDGKSTGSDIFLTGPDLQERQSTLKTHRPNGQFLTEDRGGYALGPSDFWPAKPIATSWREWLGG